MKKWYCNICEQRFCNIQSYDEHLRQAPCHEWLYDEMYDKWINDELIFGPDYIFAECRICNENIFPVDHLAQHLQGSNHKDKKDQLLRESLAEEGS